MSNFEKIKKYYLQGIYKKSHIERFLEKKLITEDEYGLIIQGKEEKN